jgi:hypothetical protein
MSDLREQREQAEALLDSFDAVLRRVLEARLTRILGPNWRDDDTDGVLRADLEELRRTIRAAYADFVRNKLTATFLSAYSLELEALRQALLKDCENI